jgi:hypothetical protein
MSAIGSAPTARIELEPHPSPAQSAAWRALWRVLLASPPPSSEAERLAQPQTVETPPDGRDGG